MHRHRKQLRGRLESCWQDRAPRADSPTRPITEHVIWKTQPQLHQRSQNQKLPGSTSVNVPRKRRWGGGLSADFSRATPFWDPTRVSGFSFGGSFIVSRGLRTAGNGVTFAEGRDDEAVTPDHGLWQQNRTRPCQAASASASCCTTPPTHSTNHPLPFPPPVHQPGRLRQEEAFARRRLHTTSIWQVSMNASPPPAPPLGCVSGFCSAKARSRRGSPAAVYY